MKFTTLLAAFAGFDLGTTSPVPTSLSANTAWALLQPRALVSWNAADAYKDEPEKKVEWEQRCRAVLDQRGCGVGVILGEQSGDGKKLHVKVLGAPNDSMDHSRQLRVYQDGSFRDGWRARSKKQPPVGGWQPAEKKSQLIPEVHHPLVYWANPDEYEHEPEKKKVWEHKCAEVLGNDFKGCSVGIIHGGEYRNPGDTPYVKVQGAPRMPWSISHSKRFRVYLDGSSQIGWNSRSTGEPKPRKKRKRPSVHRKAISNAPVVSWDPPNSYESSWPKRKVHWEEKCQKALARKGCSVGIIHKGESKAIKDGQKTSYVHVEGAPSENVKPTERMRVFYDGSHEDGWLQQSQLVMAKAKVSSSKRRKIMPPTDQEQTERSQHNVSWNPPDSYKRKGLMRQSFEDACHAALARVNCDSATIHHGRHSHRDPVDGTKSFYLNVSVWNKEKPPYNKRLMRLWETGSSEWSPEGLSWKELRTASKAHISLPPAYKLPLGRPKKHKSSSADAPPPAPTPKRQKSHQTQPVGSMEETTSTPVPLQATTSSQVSLQAPQAHPTPQTHQTPLQAPTQVAHPATPTHEPNWDGLPDLFSSLDDDDLFRINEARQHHDTAFQPYEPHFGPYPDLLDSPHRGFFPSPSH